SRHPSLPSIILLTPSSTLFPYTTLFRSAPIASAGTHNLADDQSITGSAAESGAAASIWRILPLRASAVNGLRSSSIPASSRPSRSEEHTSELQSLAYLVCRLLLEKKKAD